jgi:hypothetical protein
MTLSKNAYTPLAFIFSQRQLNAHRAGKNTQGPADATRHNVWAKSEGNDD